MSSDGVDPDELKNLTEVFRQAGVDEPESWAHSQLAEGIPQLAIFSFAKALWESVVTEGNDGWIDGQIRESKSDPSGPCSQAGTALAEMLAKGVSREAIVDLARVLQYETLFEVCSLIDGAYEPDVPITDWVLHQVDDQDNPVAEINGLHEVLLGLDPTGREMCPRSTNV